MFKNYSKRNVLGNSGLKLTKALAVILTVMSIGAGPVNAIPLKYEMVTDTLRSGVAVLQGDLKSAFGAGPSLTINAVLIGGAPTIHWSSSIQLQKTTNAGVDSYSVVSIVGRHISNPPPDPGEASPGPPLAIVGTASSIPYFHLETFAAPTAFFLKSAPLAHDSIDFDQMTSTLSDLDPANAGVLFGDNDEIRLRVTFQHISEPGTLALFGLGLLGLGYARRRMVTA